MNHESLLKKSLRCKTKSVLFVWDDVAWIASMKMFYDPKSQGKLTIVPRRTGSSN